MIVASYCDFKLTNFRYENRCWVVVASYGKVVELDTETFDLENYCPSQYTGDMVNIYDGDTCKFRNWCLTSFSKPRDESKRKYHTCYRFWYKGLDLLNHSKTNAFNQCHLFFLSLLLFL